VAVRSHPDRVDVGSQPLRRAPSPAEDSLRLRLRLDQREHTRADRLLAERLESIRVPAGLDVFCNLAQDELAQLGEILVAEEVLERDLGALLRVDLAGAQPLLKLLGREVDEHDLVGLVEDPVGERFAHANAGELEDRVVEAFEMLDVDRRDDVDAASEELVDVLVALLVAHAGGVGVREFVDQRELGCALDLAGTALAPLFADGGN
jgi:hypothetical protein